MRILHSPDFSASAAPIQQPEVSAEDLERMQSLENITSAILQKLDLVEERLRVLEENRPVSAVPSAPALDPAPAPAPPSGPISLDAEAVKKGLNKMWKYLNDGRSENAI